MAGGNSPVSFFEKSSEKCKKTVDKSKKMCYYTANASLIRPCEVGKTAW